jgi:hypothetical protein
MPIPVKYGTITSIHSKKDIFAKMPLVVTTEKCDLLPHVI